MNAVEPSRDGRVVATAGQDGFVRVWDLDRRRAVATIKAHPGSWAIGAGVSPDGRQAATVVDDGALSLWDLQSGEKQRSLRLNPTYGNSVEFSPDGSRLLVAAFDGTIRLVPVDGRGSVTILEDTTTWRGRRASARMASEPSAPVTTAPPGSGISRPGPRSRWLIPRRSLARTSARMEAMWLLPVRMGSFGSGERTAAAGRWRSG